MIHHIHYRICNECKRIIRFSICLTEKGIGNSNIFRNEGGIHHRLTGHDSGESVIINIIK